jgi:hypothetical protein
MTTTFIGLKELRKQLSRVTHETGKQRRRYIVMRKNQPVFELRPLSKKDAALESLYASVARAEADVKAGRVYTLKQVREKLGL